VATHSGARADDRGIGSPALASKETLTEVTLTLKSWSHRKLLTMTNGAQSGFLC
jgi:hypothetical protein